MVVVIFRVRLREGIDLAELDRLNQRMYELVSQQPGVRGVKEYTAMDGEAVSLVEFDNLDQVAAWRNHPEHLTAQQRGRTDFFADYRIQVCVEQYGYQRP